MVFLKCYLYFNCILLLLCGIYYFDLLCCNDFLDAMSVTSSKPTQLAVLSNRGLEALEHTCSRKERPCLVFQSTCLKMKPSLDRPLQSLHVFHELLGSWCCCSRLSPFNKCAESRLRPKMKGEEKPQPVNQDVLQTMTRRAEWLT